MHSSPLGAHARTHTHARTHARTGIELPLPAVAHGPVDDDAALERELRVLHHAQLVHPAPCGTPMGARGGVGCAMQGRCTHVPAGAIAHARLIQTRHVQAPDPRLWLAHRTLRARKARQACSGGASAPPRPRRERVRHRQNHSKLDRARVQVIPATDTPVTTRSLARAMERNRIGTKQCAERVRWPL